MLRSVTFITNISGSDINVMVGENGFEPLKQEATDLQSAPFGHSGTLPFMELVMGLEPATC